MRLSRFRLLAAAAVPVAAAGAMVGVVSMTAQAATAGCRVSYQVTSQWPGGFGANVNLTNLGDPLTGWTLTWSFSAGQTVTQAWSTALTQSGAQVTARNAAWNGSIGTNGSASFGFNGSWNNGSNPVPASFALNGVTCNGGVASPPPTTPVTGPPTTAPPTTAPPTTAPPTTAPPTSPPPSGSHGPHTMGFIGCSMAENVAQGYVADGGKRMWGPYGTGGLVWNTWTDPNSSSWQLFDRQAAQFGKPDTVWVQLCTFASPLPTYNDAKTLIANARQHAAPGAAIIISGMPQYDPGHVCSLAGATGTPLTDTLAKQAGGDATQRASYPGQFHLPNSEVLGDTCHANTAGQNDLGHQALAFWG